MRAEDNDKLWEVLGKAKQPAVSPFFARNVLRTVRQEAQEPGIGRMGGIRSVRRWIWQLALGCTCVAAALITIMPGAFVRHHHRASQASSSVAPVSANSDFEVIKHLDELVADEQSSVWLDDTVN